MRISRKNIEVLKLEFPKTVDKICIFIRKILKQSGARGVVLGLSGGVDSSLTAYLCVKALGKEKVLGVFMPASFTPRQDIEDAQELAKRLRIRTEYVSIQEISETFLKTLKVDLSEKDKKIAVANVRARIRMVILYYYANANNYLVAGTGDRSELLLGFFTKYGDGGTDFLPIGQLYKTQVRELAEFLGIPRSIAYKPSSPQLYPGHKLSDELPLDYTDIDRILVGLFEYKLSPKEVSNITSLSLNKIKEIMHRHKVSRHKLSFPAMISL